MAPEQPKSDGPASMPKKKDKEKVSPISWRSVTLAAMIGGLMFGFMMYLKHEKQNGKTVIT